MARSERRAAVERQTRETQVRLALDLDGTGAGRRRTGVGFFDHLLDALAKHGKLDLEVEVAGDLATGPHHTVEDTGLALGRALDRALGERAGIARFGEARVPMDDALAWCVIDISGRPYAALEARFPRTQVADFEVELCAEFLRAVANSAGLTVHAGVERGENTHHMVEALFKAFGLALRRACASDARERGIPSTKGSLREGEFPE